jgi:hypothetical protein
VPPARSLRLRNFLRTAFRFVFVSFKLPADGIRRMPATLPHIVAVNRPNVQSAKYREWTTSCHFGSPDSSRERKAAKMRGGKRRLPANRPFFGILAIGTECAVLCMHL